MNKIAIFAELGRQLSMAIDDSIGTSDENLLKINLLIDDLVLYNGWFTPKNVRFCLDAWAQALTEKNLVRWLKSYDFSRPIQAKNIGLILAGNIPMVGFHDVLCLLLSGHRGIIKCAASDNRLLPAIVELLCNIESHFSEQITFTNGLLQDVDAYIATGSNNSGRYFDFYFQKYPHIIRRNRNSVAILTGNESQSQLQQLGMDIFCYFGLGCRNVSKIFVPKNYDFQLLEKSFSEWKQVEDHHKYRNNLDYNKAIFLVNGDEFFDGGFFLLKPDTGMHSPISVVFYETYNTIDESIARVLEEKNQIQCVVSKLQGKAFVPFGQAQHPQLWDYADNIDTMQFLLELGS